jgi:hypothetical protein
VSLSNSPEIEFPPIPAARWPLDDEKRLMSQQSSSQPEPQLQVSLHRHLLYQEPVARFRHSNSHAVLVKTLCPWNLFRPNRPQERQRLTARLSPNLYL